MRTGLTGAEVGASPEVAPEHGGHSRHVPEDTLGWSELGARIAIRPGERQPFMICERKIVYSMRDRKTTRRQHDTAKAQ